MAPAQAAEDAYVASTRRRPAEISRRASVAGRAIPGRPRRSPRSPTTSTTSATSRASTTSGIGSDFDGGEPLPDGLEDVSGFPGLIAELLRRGYSDDDVRKVAGGNVLRVMRGAEAVAARLQAERAPSEATIEELDGPPAS